VLSKSESHSESKSPMELKQLLLGDRRIVLLSSKSEAVIMARGGCGILIVLSKKFGSDSASLMTTSKS
jgi:hypothetical protein